MRRVYDDAMANEALARISYAAGEMTFKDVSDYSWSMDRASVSKMTSYVKSYLGDDFKYGNTTHAYGIGNNNAIEVIYVGNENEEQICCLLHLNDDMYGGVYMYVTDIDDNKLCRYGCLSRFGWKLN